MITLIFEKLKLLHKPDKYYLVYPESFSLIKNASIIHSKNALLDFLLLLIKVMVLRNCFTRPHVVLLEEFQSLALKYFSHTRLFCIHKTVSLKYEFFIKLDTGIRKVLN